MIGAVVLGLVSGIFLYGPGKEKAMDSAKSLARTAEAKDLGRQPDDSSQKLVETATFAMG
jgi:hypothetical protein